MAYACNATDKSYAIRTKSKKTYLKSLSSLIALCFSPTDHLVARTYDATIECCGETYLLFRLAVNVVAISGAGESGSCRVRFMGS